MSHDIGDDRRENTTDSGTGSSRRRFLQFGAATGTIALAGCGGFLDGETGTKQGKENGENKNRRLGEFSIEEFRGSGAVADNRPPLRGTRIEELPDLSGSLSIYLGGGEGGLYTTLLEFLQQIYPEFEPKPRIAPTAQLANTIIEEKKGGQSSTDVFWAIDAGSLGVVAKKGYTVTLPQKVVEPVPKTFHPNDQWVGTAGRARSIPYNTEQFSEKEIPDDIFAFAEAKRFSGVMGWAPTYGAFRAFVTAMRVLSGEAKTKRWLEGMLAQNVTEYPNEFLVSNAVADGEIHAGFANHYYALRVKSARPDAPLDLAFTRGDAGALINTAGAEVIEGTEEKDLAMNFIRHLLSVEAQEFFATRTFAYPMIPGVPPVGGLPRIDELNPPEIDLTKLSNLKPTLKLMREVGVL